MLSWLASWLQQIIAVVLLAGFVDLLLPNKAMQRYVRLVAGLLILLTILTPIIRLLQGDFNAKLDERLSGWFEASPVSGARMPTLQDIQRDAEAMRRKREESAASLAERNLTEAMRDEIGKRTGLDVKEVTVKLGQDGQSAEIETVTVTLGSERSNGKSEIPPPADASRSETGGGGVSDHTGVDKVGSGATASPVEGAAEDSKQVKPVEPVAVAVSVETSADGSQSTGNISGERFIPVEGVKSDAVKQVLREGWAVHPQTVIVREAAAPGESGMNERSE